MYDYILDRVARGHLDLAPLVTHHFPIDHAAAAFDLAVSREKSAIGIIFNWNEGAP
jgi:threonine dehydrogenase-like Zn-dependent dehydrogenase